jgi:hypothetical protein
VAEKVTAAAKTPTEALMTFLTHDLPLILLLGASLSGPAQPADYEVGTSLVCDTQTEVERFVALFRGDAESAIAAVNSEEHNPTACGLVNAAYVRGPRIEMARHGGSAFEIVRVLVVGVDTPTGIQAVPPAVFFSLFAVKEYAV